MVRTVAVVRLGMDLMWSRTNNSMAFPSFDLDSSRAVAVSPLLGAEPVATVD